MGLRHKGPLITQENRAQGEESSKAYTYLGHKRGSK